MVYIGGLEDNPFLPKVAHHPFTLKCPNSNCIGEIVVTGILIHSPDCLVCHTPLDINPNILEQLSDVEEGDGQADVDEAVRIIVSAQEKARGGGLVAVAEDLDEVLFYLRRGLGMSEEED